MTFSAQQRRDIYKKLPEEIQDLIMDNETSEVVADELLKLNLSEEQNNLADTEILNALFCLQTLDEAVGKISDLTKKTPEQLSTLKENLEKTIFSKYNLDTKDFSNTPISNPVKTIEIRESNLPMIEEGEEVHDVPHVETPAQSVPIKVVVGPEPAPVATTPSASEPEVQVPQPEVKPVATPAEAKPAIPKPLSNVQYPGGKDPYREPLE